MFRILSHTEVETLAALADKVARQYDIAIVKEPNKTLTMIKMRESVRQSLFYIGEVIVSEAIVSLEGTKGIGVTMGGDLDKALHMAVIDAACNKGVFEDEATLLALEAEQARQMEQENALHLQTLVQFHAMDQEVPK